MSVFIFWSRSQTFRSWSKNCWTCTVTVTSSRLKKVIHLCKLPVHVWYGSFSVHLSLTPRPRPPGSNTYAITCIYLVHMSLYVPKICIQRTLGSDCHFKQLSDCPMLSLFTVSHTEHDLGLVENERWPLDLPLKSPCSNPYPRLHKQVACHDPYV